MLWKTHTVTRRSINEFAGSESIRPRDAWTFGAGNAGDESEVPPNCDNFTITEFSNSI
jgi:hypothetical protein